MGVQTGEALRVCALRGCRDAWQKKPTNMQKKYCGDKHRAKAYATKQLDKEREKIYTLLNSVTGFYTIQRVAKIVKDRLGLGAGD